MQDVMIVEGFRSPIEVTENPSLDYEDKLRILEKWNQLYAIKTQVYPDHSDNLNTARKEVIQLINQLVKQHLLLHESEMMID
jgi:hypothetical protein